MVGTGVCPDCSGTRVSRYDDARPGGSCSICGWEGETVPIKWMESDQQERLRRETEEMLQAKERGELFFLRVFPEGADLPDDTGFRISAALEPVLDCPVQDGQPYAFLRLDKRPAKELLEELGALPGVARITIF